VVVSLIDAILQKMEKCWPVKEFGTICLLLIMSGVGSYHCGHYRKIDKLNTSKMISLTNDKQYQMLQLTVNI